MQRAQRAFEALQNALQSRLLATLGAQGPAAAVAVCKVEAPQIATDLARRHDLELGRTSHRLRNPANAPRPWVVPYLARAAGRQASEVQPVVVDLGDRVGVLKPIATGGPCLLCHGDPEGFAPELKTRLAELYPNDRATGFREGEFRGFFWAEVKKSGRVP
ncbi:MAG: cytochrome c [Candidatus Binatia bacterium]|nr:MAG: cytochrome c [Candidatus Binatia bacterium]